MKVVCPSCKKFYNIDSTLIGQVVECECGTSFLLGNNSKAKIVEPEVEPYPPFKHTKHIVASFLTLSYWLWGYLICFTIYKFKKYKHTGDKKSMNNLIILFCILGFVGFVTTINTIVAPPKQSHYRSAPSSSMARVKIETYLKGIDVLGISRPGALNDPESYKSLGFSEFTRNSDGSEFYITHMFRAKNGFGGYVTATYDFTFDKNMNITNAEKQ